MDTTEIERATGWTPSRTVDENIDDVIAFMRIEIEESQPGFAS